MIFSKFKRDINSNDLENDEVFEVKDLYITTLGRVINAGIFFDSFSLKKLKNDPIIVKRINHNKKVLDVLNNIEYFHFYSNKSIKKYVGCYMAGELKPLSIVLEDKTKTHISKRELLKIFYPESEISLTSDIKDIVLKQIKDTDDKINKSSLSEEEKNNLKNKLIDIARNYVGILKNMSKSNSKSISLNTSNESVINLRREIMKKLVEIEMQLPPEDIDNISNELMLLEKDIFKNK